MRTIELKRVGTVPAKAAEEFVPGDVIALDHGYTLKVISTAREATSIKMVVEHVPEENEFWDGESTHVEEYIPTELLGIAERHGNEGLC